MKNMLAQLLLFVGFVGSVTLSFSNEEAAIVEWDHSADKIKESKKSIRVTTNDYVFKIEKKILREEHYIIKSRKDITRVNEKLKKVFDGSFLTAITLSDDYMKLKNNAVPIGIPGPFFVTIAYELIRDDILFDMHELDRVDLNIKGNTLTHKVIYKNTSNREEKEKTNVYYFYRAINENPKEISPNIVMLIPQEQLYQIYINLLREKQGQTTSVQNELLFTISPIAQDFVINGDIFQLKRLVFETSKYTYKEQSMILPATKGWKMIFPDPDDNSRFILSDFHRTLEIFLSSSEGLLKSGLVDSVEVVVSNNRIVSKTVDTRGKETIMKFYCYRAVSAKETKSLFVVFPYDIEETKNNDH